MSVHALARSARAVYTATIASVYTAAAACVYTLAADGLFGVGGVVF